MREFRPNVVLSTSFSDHHPDHRALRADLARQLVGRLGEIVDPLPAGTARH